MSIILEILNELWNTRLNYKGIPVNIFGVPRLNDYKRGSIKSACYRLKTSGLIIKNKTGWEITKRGENHLKLDCYLQAFQSRFGDDAPKNLIFMFDIPVEKRKYRDWLRRQLKLFGYKMIQQSVWVGPSPLPKEFIDYIKQIKIDRGIKTFKLAKPYI